MFRNVETLELAFAEHLQDIMTAAEKYAFEKTDVVSVLEASTAAIGEQIYQI